MLCAVEVKKDIAGLLRSVPDLDDMFNIIDKIGAGKLQTSVIYFSDFSWFLTSAVSYRETLSLLRVNTFILIINCKVIVYMATVYVTSQVAYTAANHNEVFMTRNLNVTRRQNSM